jgi:hypothetical protein
VTPAAIDAGIRVEVNVELLVALIVPEREREISPVLSHLLGVWRAVVLLDQAALTGARITYVASPITLPLCPRAAPEGTPGCVDPDECTGLADLRRQARS